MMYLALPVLTNAANLECYHIERQLLQKMWLFGIPVFLALIMATFMVPYIAVQL